MLTKLSSSKFEEVRKGHNGERLMLRQTNLKGVRSHLPPHWLLPSPGQTGDMVAGGFRALGTAWYLPLPS